MNFENKRTEFFAETVRTVVLAIFGFAAVITVVHPWEQSQAYQAQVAQRKLEIRADATRQFLKAGYAYSSVTFDVLNGTATPAERDSYHGDRWDEFRASARALEIYLADARQNEPGLPHIDIGGLLHQAQALHERIPSAGQPLPPRTQWQRQFDDFEAKIPQLAGEAYHALDVPKPVRGTRQAWILATGGVMLVALVIAAVLARALGRGRRLATEKTEDEGSPSPRPAPQGTLTLPEVPREDGNGG